MGPHFFKCGNRKIMQIKNTNFFGFNGAALFQVRKLASPIAAALEIARFNGAALFQVRKPLRRSRNRSFSGWASMGPHFFKCGNKDCQTSKDYSQTGFNGAALFQVRKLPCELGSSAYR